MELNLAKSHDQTFHYFFSPLSTLDGQDLTQFSLPAPQTVLNSRLRISLCLRQKSIRVGEVPREEWPHSWRLLWRWTYRDHHRIRPRFHVRLEQLGTVGSWSREQRGKAQLHQILKARKVHSHSMWPKPYPCCHWKRQHLHIWL